MVTSPVSPPAAPPLASAVVEARGLTLADDGLVVLSRASLTVPRGTVTGLLGPARSGKTTLLRAVVGRIAPRAGELQVLGARPGQARGRIGYAPPVERCDWRFPISVSEAVQLSRTWRPGLPFGRGMKDRRLAERCLALVGLSQQAGWPVAELTLSQRQRLGLARALAREPELLLLDEPLVGVDRRTEADLLDLLRELRRSGRTVVVATRQLEQLAQRFDWLILLGADQVYQGEPRVVATAENLRAAFGSDGIWSRRPAEEFALDPESRAP